MYNRGRASVTYVTRHGYAGVGIYIAGKIGNLASRVRARRPDTANGMSVGIGKRWVQYTVGPVCPVCARAKGAPPHLVFYFKLALPAGDS